VRKTQSSDDKLRAERRTFLQKSALVGGGVASAVALPGQALAAEDRPEPQEERDGYRMTEHIAEYYKSADL